MTKNLTPAYLRLLVGNPSAYAIQRTDGGYFPIREPVTTAVLQQHLAGEHTVGTYINKGDQARTLVFDIDTGDFDDALAVENALYQMGFKVGTAGVEESGRKGYHVWVISGSYLPAHTLRRVGLAVNAELGTSHEVFPKQDVARDLGNLVKLPGGIHRVTGTRSRFLGDAPRPTLPATFFGIAENLPEVQGSFGGESPPPFKCMEHLQEKGAPDGTRNRALFHLAVMLRRGGVAQQFIEQIVHETNSKSDPPLEDGEVAALLESSKSSGPLCRTLEGCDFHCGDDCIVMRRPGLYTRPGHIRDGADGEKVVVELKRDGKKRKLRHPDVKEVEV